MRHFLLVSILFISLSPIMKAQEGKSMELTLDQVIEIAGKQSLDAFINKNMYLRNYWEYRFFKADRRPLLSLSTTPIDYYNSVSKQYNYEDNEDYFVRRNYFTSEVGLELSQKVPFTGGEIFMSSDLSMLQNIEDNNSSSFSSTPAVVGYRQNITGYNSMRWESKLSPMEFEKAKKDYIQSRETLSQTSVSKFFQLVSAQIDVSIAENNYNNADTLYQIGQGRFKAGTITRDELLSLQLSAMNAELSVTQANQALVRANAELASFLTMDENTKITCHVSDNMPIPFINVANAVELAMENNPDILDQEIRLMEADMNVRSAKSNNGLSANVFLQFGLDNSADKLKNVYQDPSQSQRASLGLSMPILDWGRRKGSVQIAEAQKQETVNRIKQEVIDFRQNVSMNVMEFNIQSTQVNNAAKADTIANLGYDVTIQRFKIGKLEVTNLNIAQNNLSQARRAYYSALQKYWNYYYLIRKLTLYDFEKSETLSENFDELINQ
ncbi:MAG: TolC family protein [Bacteroidales bacterium]